MNSIKATSCWQQIIGQPQKLFSILIASDLLMLLLHLLFAPHSNFFHLDHEQNLPTVYQSLKLIIFGSIFVFSALKRKSSVVGKFFLMPISLFLVALGFDELLQIHENIYRVFEFIPWLHPEKVVEASLDAGYRSSLWVIYYLPIIFVFVFWCGYWFRHFQNKLKNNAWIVGLAGGSLLTVLLIELVSSTGFFNDHIYFWMVTFEELAEMIFASTFILVGHKVLKQLT